MHLPPEVIQVFLRVPSQGFATVYRTMYRNIHLCILITLIFGEGRKVLSGGVGNGSEGSNHPPPCVLWKYTMYMYIHFHVSLHTVELKVPGVDFTKVVPT